MSREAWEQLRSWSREPGTAAVLTDIDGVLAPIVPTPDMSEVSGELRDLLRRLSERYRVVAEGSVAGQPGMHCVSSA